jgi:hypothetical protein
MIMIGAHTGSHYLYYYTVGQLHQPDLHNINYSILILPQPRLTNLKLPRSRVNLLNPLERTTQIKPLLFHLGASSPLCTILVPHLHISGFLLLETKNLPHDGSRGRAIVRPATLGLPLIGESGGEGGQDGGGVRAVRGSDRGTAAVVTDQCWPLWRLLEVTSSSDRSFSGQGGGGVEAAAVGHTCTLIKSLANPSLNKRWYNLCGLNSCIQVK